MTPIAVASLHTQELINVMAKETKIGNVTFRKLSNEEARAEFGASLAFIGSKPASLEQAATSAGNRAITRLEDELKKAREKT